eukprot:2865079-Ditylum_brightwellii.AAC.1
MMHSQSSTSYLVPTEAAPLPLSQDSSVSSSSGLRRTHRSLPPPGCIVQPIKNPPLRAECTIEKALQISSSPSQHLDNNCLSENKQQKQSWHPIFLHRHAFASNGVGGNGSCATTMIAP